MAKYSKKSRRGSREGNAREEEGDVEKRLIGCQGTKEEVVEVCKEEILIREKLIPPGSPIGSFHYFGKSNSHPINGIARDYTYIKYVRNKYFELFLEYKKAPLKKLAFIILLTIFLYACTSFPSGTGVSTSIVITAGLSIVIPDRGGTELPFPTPEPPTMIPTLGGGFSPTHVKYRVLEEFPNFFFMWNKEAK